MFIMSPVLATITLLFVPILIGGTSIWQRLFREPVSKWRRAFADVNAHLQETMSGIRVVQSLNRERDNLRRFTGVANDKVAALLNMMRYRSVLLPSITVVQALGMALVVTFGGLLVLNGSIGAGVVIAFAIYVERFFGPLGSLQNRYGSLHEAMAAGSRVFEFLDIKPNISDPPGAARMPPVKGEIRFEGVGFQYQPGVPVIQYVDLTVEPGQTVAIVGPTGAGQDHARVPPAQTL